MKKFIVIYHAPEELVTKTINYKKKEININIASWRGWMSRCGDKLVDLGSPLIGGQKMIPGGKYLSSKREVCGYSILEAESMDEAKKLIDGHPHLKLSGQCEIEIHETMPLQC
jgi:hypothetical protein